MLIQTGSSTVARLLSVWVPPPKSSGTSQAATIALIETVSNG
jgi:hypothetical protein